MIETIRDAFIVITRFNLLFVYLFTYYYYFYIITCQIVINAQNNLLMSVIYTNRVTKLWLYRGRYMCMASKILGWKRDEKSIKHCKHFPEESWHAISYEIVILSQSSWHGTFCSLPTNFLVHIVIHNQISSQWNVCKSQVYT